MDGHSFDGEESEQRSSTSGGGTADSSHLFDSSYNLASGDVVSCWPVDGGCLPPVQRKRSLPLRTFSGGSPEYAGFDPVVGNAAFRSVSSVGRRNLSTQVGSGSKFPTPESDDAEMMRAMVAVLSSSTAISPTSCSSNADHRRINRGEMGFRPYISSEAVIGTDGKHMSKVNESKPNSTKLVFSMMRNINDRRVAQAAAASAQEHQPPQTNNQVHHMISERKRREKLNESFLALRSELPPRTRKDKASILVATKEYLMELKSRISNIESKNQELENHLSDSVEESTAGVKMDMNEKRRIEFSNASLESSSGRLQEINGRIMVRIEDYWNVVDLVLHILRCLKVMGNINLVSLNHLPTTSTLVVQIKAEADLDVENLQKDIERAIDETLRIFSTEQQRITN